ncbi:MAG: FAD-dependent oxidoreductase [Actinobacteria bacterium]|nr:FAD-dependent oxidoreductase [Actinomycetota bacterium]
MRVAVVGGGLAGIAAALECADAGAEVTLLEARPRLGGATFSIHRDGIWMDNGQHVFLRCCTAYRQFLVRIEATDRTVLQPRLSIPVVSPGGRIARLERARLPAPLHLLPSLARFSFLSPRERLGIARAVRPLARLDLDDPSLDRRTFGSWLSEHGQSQAAVDALWNLIVLPTVNLPAAEASLALAAKVFQTGLLESADAGDIGYAAVPLQHVHGDAGGEALDQAGVPVRLRTRVDRIERRDGGFSLAFDGEGLDADAVVLTVPHDDAAALLPEGALPQADELGYLGASPIVNLHVVYDRPVTELPFAAGHESPVQWVFDRTRGTGLGQGQYLAVSLSCAREYIGRKVEELRAQFVPALEQLFPEAASARVELFFVTREQRATFRQGPGTSVLRPGPRTQVEGLYLAGAWTDTGWPATMEGAVRSGIDAAREVVGRDRHELEVAA